MCFTIFWNKKPPSQAIITRRSKSRQIKVFPKGLTHGFCRKIAIFPTFFLGNIGQKNVFYDILKRKNDFLPYKKRSSKSRKIEIFPKGLTHCLVKKWPFFHLFFSALQATKCVLRYSKTIFYAIKTTSSKSRKLEIFPKALTHRFGQKMVIFPTFFLGNIGQKNVFYDILEQ